jgi:ribosomal protein L40E
MIFEIMAALVVGIFALALIVEPLLRAVRQPSAALDLPDPEETPRGIALSALREIEFDKETGKLSDTDYTMLKERYTKVAVQAMRAEEQVSEGAIAATASPDAVEAIIAAKVRALRSAQPNAQGQGVCPTCGPRPEPDAVFCSTCGSRLPTGTVCAGCGAALDPEARFCESCGSKQARSA